MGILFDDSLSARLERDDPRGPASAQGVDHLGAVLDGVSPCYGDAPFGEPPMCGSTRREACSRLHDENAAADIFVVCRWLYSCAPAKCWGSEGRVLVWLEAP